MKQHLMCISSISVLHSGDDTLNPILSWVNTELGTFPHCEDHGILSTATACAMEGRHSVHRQGLVVPIAGATFLWMADAGLPFILRHDVQRREQQHAEH